MDISTYRLAVNIHDDTPPDFAIEQFCRQRNGLGELHFSTDGPQLFEVQILA